MALEQTLWAHALDVVRRHVVRIQTRVCQGTGFFLSAPGKTAPFGVVTAFHVIEEALRLHEPVNLVHETSGAEIELSGTGSNRWGVREQDVAFFEFDRTRLPVPQEPLLMIKPQERLLAGMPIGWCGFPAMFGETLCFFRGHISAWLDEIYSYVVDGVAIHGVSGGPVFAVASTREPAVIGFISSYIPNTLMGNVVLPGVSMVRGINFIGDFLGRLQT